MLNLHLTSSSFSTSYPVTVTLTSSVANILPGNTGNATLKADGSLDVLTGSWGTSWSATITPTTAGVVDVYFMGLSSMYMSSLTMIITLFGLGINSSVVRDLSKAFDENDMERFSVIIKVFRRILLILSASGLLCVVLMSPLLSKWAFGSPNKALDYCCLSLIVYFTLLAQGNDALLIGMRRIKAMAMCSLIGSVVTLAASIPFFYFWGLKGIVPGLIISTVANYLVTYFYVRKICLSENRITWDQVKSYGRPMEWPRI